KYTGAYRTRENKKGRRVGQRRRPGEMERRTTLQVMVITNIVRFLYQSSDSQPDCSAASRRRVNRLLIRPAVSPGWHRERGQECVGWRQLTPLGGRGARLGQAGRRRHPQAGAEGGRAGVSSRPAPEACTRASLVSRPATRPPQAG